MSLDYVDPTTPPPADWIGPGYPDPLFYGGAALWCALLVGAVIGILIYRQRLYDERALRRRGPEVIYLAVRKALDQALVKTGDETVAAGRRVAEVMELHLGPLFAFGHGAGSPFKRLEKALEGKAVEKLHAPEHGHEHGDGHGRDHAAHVAEPTIVVTATAEREVVVAPARIISAEPKREAHLHHHPTELTARERRLAVREALEELSDYWRREAVERDLRRIQEALCVSARRGAASRLLERRAASPFIATPVGAPRPAAPLI